MNATLFDVLNIAGSFGVGALVAHYAPEYVPHASAATALLMLGAKAYYFGFNRQGKPLSNILVPLESAICEVTGALLFSAIVEPQQCEAVQNALLHSIYSPIIIYGRQIAPNIHYHNNPSPPGTITF